MQVYGNFQELSAIAFAISHTTIAAFDTTIAILAIAFAISDTTIAILAIAFAISHTTIAAFDTTIAIIDTKIAILAMPTAGYAYAFAAKYDTESINNVIYGLSPRVGKPRPYGCIYLILFQIGITNAP